MHKLISQLKRLYFLPGQQGRWSIPAGASPSHGVLTDDILTQGLKGQASVALDLLSLDGQVRTLVLGFEQAADWQWVADLYQGILEDLELPAPAMAISGKNGYQVWFSLETPIPVAQGQAFLTALCHRYLAELPTARYRLWPAAESARPDHLEVVPAEHESSGKWSAFITASMGAMFREEPGLEMAPNPDRQADLLAPVVSVSAADLARALDRLATPIEPVSAEAPAMLATVRSDGQGGLGGHYTDPKSFLLAVMNDLGAAPELRVAAAAALLPYFEGKAVTTQLPATGAPGRSPGYSAG